MMIPATALVRTAASSTSLKKIISERLKKIEDANCMTSESWLRASGLSEICPREEALCAAGKVIRKREISSDLGVIFEHGKALHNQLQNSLLPELGLILGKWSCTYCGTVYGEKEDGPVESWAVKRPEKCESWVGEQAASCPGTSFLYHEVFYGNKDLRIGGHPDGFLSIEGLEGLGILEAKSISPNGAWEVKNVPKLEHAIQAQIYMWLTGLSWTKILYWDKGTNGVNAFTEHQMERDDETIEAIKRTIQEIHDGVAGGPLPERICASSEAPRACTCAVVGPCFKE